MSKREIIFLWATAGGLSLILLALVLPWLLWGLPPGSDLALRADSLSLLFLEQLRQGNYLPRWLPSMHLGRGSPVFFFEAPFAYYARSLLSVLLQQSPLAQLDVLFAGVHAALTLFLSSLMFYFWLIRIAHTRVAIYGALVYAFLPFHLVLHSVVENNIGLQWSYVWIPLGLRCVDSIQLRQRRGLLGLALVVGLFFLSNPLTALAYVLMLFAYSFISPRQLGEEESYRADALRVFVFALYAVLLGAGAASYYLVPAMELAPFSLLGEQSSNVLLQQQFFLHGSAENFLYPYRDAVFLATIVFAASFFFSSSAMLERGTRVFVTFWMGLSCVYLLAMTELSAPLWFYFSSLPVLLEPQSLSPLLSFSVAALIPAADSSRQDLARPSLALFAQLYAILLLPGSILLASFLWTQSQNTVVEPNRFLKIEDKYAPMLSQLEELPVSYLKEGPSVTAAVLESTSGLTKLRVHSILDSHVIFGQYYFPLWYARINEQALRLGVMPSAEGLLEILLPPGEYEVEVVFGKSRGEIAGNSISIVSCAAWLILLILSVYFLKREKFQLHEEEALDALEAEKLQSQSGAIDQQDEQSSVETTSQEAEKQ